MGKRYKVNLLKKKYKWPGKHTNEGMNQWNFLYTANGDINFSRYFGKQSDII